MARIVYQDSRVTEYADGTEEVRFSDDENAIMERNPRYFELCLPCGHSRSYYNACEGCNACLTLAESAQDYEDDPEGFAALVASFPKAPADKDF